MSTKIDKRRLNSTNTPVLINAIKAKRLAKGWTLREMEEYSGVDHATLSRAERGKEPTLTNALKLAAALDTPVEDLWVLER